jgi:hypothetical protein
MDFSGKRLVMKKGLFAGKLLLVDRKKFIMIGLFGFFSVILLLNLAGAFGVVASYWDGNPLVLEPGESKDITFRLQNILEQDILVMAELVEGEEIARFSDSSLKYNIPAGTGSVDSVKVNMAIEIPGEVKIGDEYIVEVLFRQVEAEGSGTVQFAPVVGKKFPVKVGRVLEAPEAPEALEDEEEISDEVKGGRAVLLWLVAILIFLAVIIVLGIVYLVIKIKQEKENEFLYRD